MPSVVSSDTSRVSAPGFSYSSIVPAKHSQSQDAGVTLLEVDHDLMFEYAVSTDDTLSTFEEDEDYYTAEEEEDTFSLNEGHKGHTDLAVLSIDDDRDATMAVHKYQAARPPAISISAYAYMVPACTSNLTAMPSLSSASSSASSTSQGPVHAPISPPTHIPSSAGRSTTSESASSSSLLPTSALRGHRAIPQHPLLITPFRPWLDPYNKGIESNSPSKRATYARGVVSMRDWTGPRLQDLAWCLTWEATEPQCPLSDPHGPGPIAKFTQALVRSFRENYGDDVSDAFVWHIRDYALHTFCGWWSPHSKQSLVKAYQAKSPNLETQIFCSFAVANYIGHLYRLELINAADLHRCIDAILFKFIYIEQLIAVHMILASTKGRMVKTKAEEQMMSQFISEFDRMIDIEDNASLKRVRFRQEKVKELAADVLRIAKHNLSAFRH
ncbi:hypothetical protein EW146_g3508 [Bondarzewia mesenterica]|uniref:Uncharacterized protein n=1 Tax=Bondarzewia mesenterica TaxID=1095465 RepID=A0A4S4LYT5_9AGAM|nr:hypothetical protein EW146_g3508 [Bondarzewia mesenterica]